MTGRTGLILDFGGVLTSTIPSCAAAFDRAEGLPPGTLLTAITRDPDAVAWFADLERGAITQPEWNRRMGGLLGVPPDDLMRRVLADLRPEPRMIAAARAARRAGIKVGVLSNSLGLAPYDPYPPYELAANYDAVLLSEHHRMRKPDPELYRVMLEMLGLPGERCVFVDDTRRNLPPAEDLGIATVLARDPDQTVRQVEALLGLPLTPPA